MFEYFKKKNGLFYLSAIALLCFFFVVRSILFPFIIGLLMAYFCKNTVEKYEHKISRHWLSMIIIALCYLVLSICIFVFIPLLFTQIVSLIRYLIIYLNEVDINNVVKTVYTKLNLDQKFQLDELVNMVNNNLTVIYQSSLKYFGNLSNYLLSYSIQLVNIITMLFISPIMGFYFLRDWNVIVYKIKTLMPNNIRKTAVELFKNIDDVLQSFLVSQFVVCSIFAVYYSVLLYFSGLKYGFTIGLITGALTCLPYIGSISCGITCFVVACVQYGTEFSKVVLVMVIFFLGSFLEGNFVTPKIVGDKIKIHPLWIMFALFASGTLLGFVGIFFALPIAGIIGVVIRFYLNKRKKPICLITK